MITSGLIVSHIVNFVQTVLFAKNLAILRLTPSLFRQKKMGKEV